MGNRHYEDEKKRLSSLSRPERFEELMDFPCSHAFKIIGAPDGLVERVMEVMAQRGHPDATPQERPSSKGRWLAVTVEIQAKSGAELDALYTELEQLEGVKCLF